jgi:hypothetical protein
MVQRLHCTGSPLQNATISKMNNDNFKALQKALKAIALYLIPLYVPSSEEKLVFCSF